MYERVNQRERPATTCYRFTAITPQLCEKINLVKERQELLAAGAVRNIHIRKIIMPKLESDSLLMITIFQQVHNGDGISDPMKYLERYARDIKEAGQLFAYLDLAEHDRISPLGFKPTRRFIEILAEPENDSSTPDKKLGESAFILDLLGDAVFGEPGVRNLREPGILGYDVLHALGLIHENRAGYRGSTPFLLRLFANGYYKNKIVAIIVAVPFIVLA
jgi:hypothetical protein